MLITKSNFTQFLGEFHSKLTACQVDRKGRFIVGLDTETTGIWWWNSPNVPWYKPRVFSIQFSLSDTDCYYLDFNHSPDKLDDVNFSELNIIFRNEKILWAIQNGKFELHQLRNHGIEIVGDIHCTKAMARVTNSLEGKLNLEVLAEKYLTAPKGDVKTYIEENGLFTIVDKFGEPDKWLHFDKLPLELLIEYGNQDTRLCRQLCELQLKTLAEMQIEFFNGSKASIWNLYENEMELTKTFFEMERVGVQVDIPYCKEAYAFEIAAYQTIASELNEVAGKYFPERVFNWASSDDLGDFFNALGIKSYKVTKIGNASWDKEALAGIDSEHARRIEKYRYHYMRAHTYFQNYIWLADTDGVLHPDFQQAAAVTGRVSCWAPNLQNVPKRKDKGEVNYKIRRAFIPRPGFFFSDKDYNAAEYRMMFDYARELEMIARVIAGEDVHDVTLDELKLADRDTAKTTNFATLYGQGDASFAKSLKQPIEVAKQLKQKLMGKFPKVIKFIADVRNAAKQRGYVIGWLGRVSRVISRGGFSIETWYKSPNTLIQGGVGDLTKKACNECHKKLVPYKSRLILQVHDALLFEIANDEAHLIPELITTMEQCYPHKALPMKAEAEFSRESWASLQDTY